ncbi:MAG TPA: alpha-hydroxy acid oxidase [Hyphomicrobiales bacterium]|nr:alpha-hydroxy acid oxidase [Hyphomicrobiales bacterium]
MAIAEAREGIAAQRALAEEERASAATRRRLRKLLCLDDFEEAARRTVPRALFGFLSGGVEDNVSRELNRATFARIGLVPRVAVDVSQRSTATELFGRRYVAPFGISAMGASGLSAFRGDLVLARAAAEAGIPFMLSGSSSVTMERIREVNPQAWFQAYLTAERGELTALVDRAAAAGYETLVVTLDVPVPGNRENNVRNGYSIPLRPTLRLAIDGIGHPRWLLGTALRTLRHDGMPHFENFTAARGAPLLSGTHTRAHRREALNWADLEFIRGRWKGRLVLKGILSPADAAMARERGIDGVIVSNHGGRQLDTTVPPATAVPAIAKVADGMTVIGDSGLRRGTDVIKMLGLGAGFTFVGRPFIYAAAVGGVAGVLHAVSLLKSEIDRDLALLGCTDLSDLASRLALPADWPRP